MTKGYFSSKQPGPPFCFISLSYVNLHIHIILLFTLLRSVFYG